MENTEAWVVASNQIRLEVNDDKTKYVVMSWGQNAGRSHNIETDNISFERVEEFKCLETTLKNQNSVQKKIKSRFKSGNAFYHLMQNPLSSGLLSKNLKIKDIQNYDFACCFVWLWNLIADIEGGT